MDETKPAQRIGDYEFLDLLAVGGMGRLWRVRHVKLGAIYVAKELRADLRGDPEFAKRFLHEAQLVANFRHPNVVQVFGYDEEHMIYFMEYVEGMDLDKLLRSGRQLEFGERRCIIEVVADTIGHAHRELDLIHRDIKPSNVLIAVARPEDPVQRSRIKLTDFGIARVMSISQRVTMSSGMVMGTVHYMAPEQFEGQANKPSDVYSIGVLYYQLLTGRTPFDGPTAFVIRDKHLHEIPAAPHEVDPSIPLDDSLIVMKCLEKDPANRFQDGLELYDELVETRPSPRTVTLAIPRIKTGRPSTRVRTGAAPKPPEPEPAAEEGAEATALLPPTRKGTRPITEATGATLAPPAAEPTRRTIPAPVAEPTLATRAVPRQATRLRRTLRAAAIAVGALAALVLLGALILRPRYEVRWNTLRSDPLDTPAGISVAICPSIGCRLVWWPVGTIAAEAPPNWANWTTWFDTIDVRFSDGYYREFALTCRKGADAAYVDFGGLTFAQLAAARQAKIRENPARIGHYIRSVLTPWNVAKADCLPDARAFIDRVDGLRKRAQEDRGEGALLEAYGRAAAQLTASAEALADGRLDQAEARLREAETALGQIPKESAADLPKDFLFRQTLATAIATAKERQEAAAKAVDGLGATVESMTTLRITFGKYKEADAAVAQYVLFTPGRTAFGEVARKAGKNGATAESLLNGLADPGPPVVLLRDYLAKLDALIRQKAGKEQEATCRAGALMLLNGQLKAPPPSWPLRGAGVPPAGSEAAGKMPAAPPGWVEACFAQEDRAFVDVASKFWLEAHRRRFADALRLCLKLGDENLVRAAALAPGPAGLREALTLYEDAEKCLVSAWKASEASEDDKRAASTLLSACYVKHAVCLFALGPQGSGKEEATLNDIRVLLDQGLGEVPGCPAGVQEEGRALREAIKVGGGARAKLAAACRENFAAEGTLGGSIAPLFAALDAYEGLAAGLKDQADQASAKAALAPFTSLDAPSCKGFSLPNAAACWLLANAVQSCEKGQYAEAAGFLAAFRRSPKPAGAEQAESPLKRLLAPELTAKAEKLADIAACFDETKVPAEGLDPAARQKKLWDARLAAKPLLDTALPQSVPPNSLPAPYKGQEEQWAAVYAPMRTLQGHYRDRVLAEEELRRLEADVAKLVIREGDTVRPNPAAASPDAVKNCAAALEGIKNTAEKGTEDQRARVDRVRRSLDALGKDVGGADKRIADLLAKADPKAALDELATWKASLGKTGELDLTRQALAAYAKQATKEIDAAKFDAAIALFQAIPQHEQIARHRDEPAVKGVLEEVAKAIPYCEAQRSLGRGPADFAAALPKLRAAAGYRDAEALARQLAAFLDAEKLQAGDPFQASKAFADLLKDKELKPKIREAADAAAGGIRASLAGGAAACAKAFDQALSKGGWEPLIDAEAVGKAKVESLKAFLAQAEGLDVQEVEAPAQPLAEIQADRKVALVMARRLKFNYLLPGQAKLPIALDQSIRWVLRNAPPQEGKERRWVIVDWDDAQP